MALTPGIALGYRPPQLQPLEIQSPLERFGKVLTLRGMMEQQQLRQMNIEQTRLENQALQQTAADDRALRNIYASGREPAEGELYATVGLKTGMTILKARQEFEKSKLDKQISNLELAGKRTTRLAQLAAGIRGPDQWKPTILRAASEELFPPEVSRQLMESGYDPKTVERFATGALDAVQRHNLEIADLKEKRDALLFPYQERKAIAEAKGAEQTVLGTQPITQQQKAQAEQQLWTDPGGLIAIMNDPKRSEADRLRAAAGYQKHEGLRRAGASTTSVITPNQNVANEARLRDDYRKDTERYVLVRNSHNDIVGAAKSGTAAGDVALIYAFMKVLDPRSAVMTGEQATARNAGGIPERIRVTYNNARDGQILDPKVRADFVAQSERIFGQSHADYLKTKDMYIGIAKRGGMDPLNVVIDYSTAAPAGQSLPAGTVIEVNGKRYAYTGQGNSAELSNYKELR